VYILNCTAKFLFGHQKDKHNVEFVFAVFVCQMSEY